MSAETSPKYSRSDLRKLLTLVLRTDADLEAFCVDRFPAIHQRFTLGMERQQKLTLLIDLANPTEILFGLEDVDQAVVATFKPTGAPATGDSKVAQEDEKAALEAERERRSRCGAETADIDKRLRAIEREQRNGRVLKPDMVIGERYVLHQQLSAGGLAEVFRAYDRQKRRNVALKALRAKHARDPSKVERFVHGAQVMAALRHPAIPTVLQAPANHDGIDYFVMEFVEAIDLHQAVEWHRLSRDELISRLVEVGQVIHAVHEQGYIHRDLNPRRVLIADKRPMVRLIGFDLALRNIEAEGDLSASISFSGVSCSNQLYAAPELASTIAIADRRSDLYSLAMLFVLALYGKALTAEVLEDRGALLNTLDAPGPFKRVIASALSAKPRTRPPTVADFLNAIESAQAGAPSPLALSASMAAGPLMTPVETPESPAAQPLRESDLRTHVLKAISENFSSKYSQTFANTKRIADLDLLSPAEISFEHSYRKFHYAFIEPLTPVQVGILKDAQDPYLRQLRVMSDSELFPFSLVLRVGEAQLDGQTCTYVVFRPALFISLSDLFRVKGQLTLPWRQVIRIAQQLGKHLDTLNRVGIYPNRLSLHHVFVTIQDYESLWMSSRAPAALSVINPDFQLLIYRLIPEGRDSETHLGIRAGRIVIAGHKYASPEEFFDLPLTPSSDVYSLGVLLFRLLTGSFPYPAADLLEQLMLMGKKAPRSLGEVNPAVPAAFSKLVDRMLQRNSEARPAFPQVLAALDELE